MITAHYDWKPYGASITIDRAREATEEKCFIIVRRKGKEHFRRYKHPIKNGKSISDLVVWGCKRKSPLLEALTK